MEKIVYWLRDTRDHPATATWLWAGTWGCVLAMAAIHLPVPLTGDQGLYMYGAKELAAGKTLYLDFWDAKQPGVYLFYLLAGSLFGFTPIGLHVMETIWFAMAAWCAYRLGKSASPDGLAPLVIPVLSAGTYFASVGAWHMSQPDGLMATPVVASIWRSATASCCSAGQCAWGSPAFSLAWLPRSRSPSFSCRLPR